MLSHEEVVEQVAKFYEVEPDSNGEYNTSDYDFTAGCYLHNGLWLNLSSVVDCVEEILENIKGGILND